MIAMVVEVASNRSGGSAIQQTYMAESVHRNLLYLYVSAGIMRQIWRTMAEVRRR